MRRRLGLTLLLVTLTTPRLSWPIAAVVIDPAAIEQAVQGYILQGKQLLEAVEQTKRQIDMVRNQLLQLEHLRVQVEQGITNLKRFDINKPQDLLNLTNVLQSKLAEAQYLGYEAKRASTQVQTLYPKIAGILDAGQQRTLYLQWAEAKRDTARVAIQTQAIADSQAKYQQQWANLVASARAAEGNLQIQQTAVQAQAVVGNQLLSIEQHLATQAREQSQKSLEEATRIVLEQNAIQHVTSTMDTTYTAQGKILAMPRTGRE